jgi:hypothetical protein
MIKLPQLRHAVLAASLASQAGCVDGDLAKMSSIGSDLVTYHEIKSFLNHKCLDISAVDPNNGAHVVMWDCFFAANQRWYWNGEEIRSLLNNKCLDISAVNPDNDAHVVMWDCHGGANQHWYWDANQIKSRLNNKCLDISAVNPNNGAHVVMWDCHGGANQQWYRVP